MIIDKNRITILYDNNLYNRNLKSGWGFSCLVTFKDSTILFDTGADSDTLLYNMNHLGINPKIINTIVISHMHFDHTGGLIGLLTFNINYNKNMLLFFPSSAGNRDIKLVESLGILKQNIRIITKPQKIANSIYTTGSLGGFIKEQSLIINTNKGIIIITGCAHPGISYIVEKSIKLLKSNPLLVIGGFHLFGRNDREILKIIKKFKKLGVKYVSPCHCSGDNARILFKKEYGKYYIADGVGKIININDLE
ncbi:MAG: MBL fold metallo-hydrolase [Spirochaetes bacterium]|nr:MAG: MBL fold metallo-hydrolase [Spirochaetota bacterium]